MQKKYVNVLDSSRMSRTHYRRYLKVRGIAVKPPSRNFANSVTDLRETRSKCQSDMVRNQGHDYLHEIARTINMRL